MNQDTLLEFLLTRRSIRKYTLKPITKNILEGLIRVASSAPSAGNQQPWEFVILDDKQLVTFSPA